MKLAKKKLVLLNCNHRNQSTSGEVLIKVNVDFNVIDLRSDSWTLKMEAASSYEALVTIYRLTQHHVPDGLNLHQHSCENLISLQIMCSVFAKHWSVVE